MFWPCVAELRVVPVEAPVVVPAEEVQILRLGQVDLGVLNEHFVQPGGSGLARPDVEEVRQCSGHGDRLSRPCRGRSATPVAAGPLSSWSCPPVPFRFQPLSSRFSNPTLPAGPSLGRGRGPLVSRLVVDVVHPPRGKSS